MEKSIIDKIDSYIDARKKLITCYTETLYHTLKFSKLLNDKNFIAGLESGLKKLLLGYLCDIRFYYRFLNDIKIKYPEFDIKKIQKNIFILETANVKNYYICLNDINIISFKEIVVKDMKFDVAIMNPPYNGSLHLEIIESLIPYIKNIVSINPVRWLQDPLACYKSKTDYKRFEHTIAKYISSLDIIKAKDAVELFGGEENAAFKIDLGIYVINADGGFNYNFGKNQILDKIISSDCCGIPVKKFSECISGNFCLVNDILGNHSGVVSFNNYMPYIKTENVYTRYYINFLGENGKTVQENKAASKRSVNGNINNWSIVELPEDELENFYNFTNTLFFKYIFIKHLVDVHVHHKYLPFMKTYKCNWTNQLLCNYFGITGYISDTEAEPNSEWEMILKEMNE